MPGKVSLLMAPSDTLEEPWHRVFVYVENLTNEHAVRVRKYFFTGPDFS